MVIEELLGRRWRARAATIAACALGAPAGSASAAELVVTSASPTGRGSLSAVIERANRIDGRNQIAFARRVRRGVRVPGSIEVVGALRIRGPASGIDVRGPSSGSVLGFKPRGRRLPEHEFLIDHLDLERVRVEASGYKASADLRIVASTITGIGAKTGVAFSGAYYGGAAVIRDSTISGFSTGVSVRYTTDDPLRIVRSTVTDNGLGIAITEARAELVDSTVSGNSPAGGITASYYAGVGITRSTITRNEDSTPFGNLSRAVGGGVDAAYLAGGSIVNSTITGNVASGPDATGGGVYGNFRIVGSTITDNTAVNGGGIAEYGANGANDYVVDSIVDGNAATSGSDCLGPVRSQGHNLFGPEGCGLAGPGDLLAPDPRLAPLADNGGPTRTQALLPDSPAIDAGTDAGLETDQRGVARTGTPDIGAFELR